MIYSSLIKFTLGPDSLFTQVKSTLMDSYTNKLYSVELQKVTFKNIYYGLEPLFLSGCLSVHIHLFIYLETWCLDTFWLFVFSFYLFHCCLSRFPCVSLCHFTSFLSCLSCFLLYDYLSLFYVLHLCSVTLMSPVYSFTLIFSVRLLSLLSPTCFAVVLGLGFVLSAHLQMCSSVPHVFRFHSFGSYNFLFLLCKLDKSVNPVLSFSISAFREFL